MRTAKCTDERVRIMSEIVSGASVLKMYGWEEAARKRVGAVRAREVGHIRWASVVRGVNEGECVFVCVFVYRYMSSASCSQFDRLPPRNIFDNDTKASTLAPSSRSPLSR